MGRIDLYFCVFLAVFCHNAATISANRNDRCIEMTPEREALLQKMTDEISDFLASLAKRYMSFDFKYIQFDIEGHSEFEIEEPATVHININDCADEDDPEKEAEREILEEMETLMTKEEKTSEKGEKMTDIEEFREAVKDTEEELEAKTIASSELESKDGKIEGYKNKRDSHLDSDELSERQCVIKAILAEQGVSDAEIIFIDETPDTDDTNVKPKKVQGGSDIKTKDDNIKLTKSGQDSSSLADNNEVEIIDTDTENDTSGKIKNIKDIKKSKHEKKLKKENNNIKPNESLEKVEDRPLKKTNKFHQRFIEDKTNQVSDNSDDEIQEIIDATIDDIAIRMGSEFADEIITDDVKNEPSCVNNNESGDENTSGAIAHASTSVNANRKHGNPKAAEPKTYSVLGNIWNGLFKNIFRF